MARVAIVVPADQVDAARFRPSPHRLPLSQLRAGALDDLANGFLVAASGFTDFDQTTADATNSLQAGRTGGALA